MFKFLKDKFKKAVDGFSKKAEEEVTKPSEEEIAKATQEEKFVKKTKDSVDSKKEKKSQEKPEIKKEKKTEKTISKEEPKQKTPEEKPVQEIPEKEKPQKPKVTETQESKEAEKTPTEVEEVDSEEKVQEVVQKEKKVEVPEEPAVVEEPKTEEPVSEKQEIEEKQTSQTPEKPKGIFSSIKESFTKVQLTEDKFEDLFWDLEMSLLENNVAVEVIEKIKEDLKKTLTEGKVTRKGLAELIEESLRASVEELFEEPFDLVQKVQEKKPYVIAFVGVNGSGKTTTLAKIANMFQENNLGVVMAAADTFRAAAIDQLQSHANTLGIKLISQGYGADPAAVAYDAIEHAKAKDIDVVMIDTAGRLHSNNNLMAELEKVIRVAKPDLKIFIGESITGNDCVEQAQQFDQKVGIDAIILSKADIDEKGGAAISVSYVTKKPILYLGTGQSYGDLEVFDKERILRTIGLL